MDLVGVVESVSGNDAIVQIKRVSGCGGNCKSCGGGCETAFHGLKAVNHVNAMPGDQVQIEYKESESMKASLIIYLIPLFGFLMGALIGKWLDLSEVAAFFTGLVGLAAGYFGIHLLDKKYKKTMLLATIKKVI